MNWTAITGQFARTAHAPPLKARQLPPMTI
jgi:hypothetical protein